MPPPGPSAVVRLDLGWFVRPPTETGTGAPRVEPLLAYVVLHPAGNLLFDTGMGSEPEVDAHYRPHRFDLRKALTNNGFGLDDIAVVSNCHLHFDHCGGNPLLRGRPVFTQRAELAAARGTADYTLPELVEGDDHVELDGESEVLPGVHVVPTAGHTEGHQSLVVRLPDGTLVLAGQSHDTASAWSADMAARRAVPHEDERRLPVTPDWLARVEAFDPRRVVFAHDLAVWEL